MIHGLANVFDHSKHASCLANIGTMVRSRTRVDTRLAEFVCESCHV